MDKNVYPAEVVFSYLNVESRSQKGLFEHHRGSVLAGFVCQLETK